MQTYFNQPYLHSEQALCEYFLSGTDNQKTICCGRKQALKSLDPKIPG